MIPLAKRRKWLDQATRTRLIEELRNRISRIGLAQTARELGMTEGSLARLAAGAESHAGTWSLAFHGLEAAE
jgi:hypothetical protein